MIDSIASMKYVRLSFFLLAFIVTLAATAQVTVKGHVVNQDGNSVEYACVGIMDDSISTITDAQGRFSLVLPAGRQDELVVSHISYLTTAIPFSAYKDGEEVAVNLVEKLVAQPAALVPKNSKLKMIVGKRVGGPEVDFTKEGEVLNMEYGIMFNGKKNHALSDIYLTIKRSTYDWCVLSFNLYESGIITKAELIRRLKTYKLVDQLLFHTERSLESLKFIGYKEIR